MGKRTDSAYLLKIVDKYEAQNNGKKISHNRKVDFMIFAEWLAATGQLNKPNINNNCSDLNDVIKKIQGEQIIIDETMGLAKRNWSGYNNGLLKAIDILVEFIKNFKQSTKDLAVKFKRGKTPHNEIISKALRLGLQIEPSFQGYDCYIIQNGWLSPAEIGCPLWKSESIVEITEKDFMENIIRLSNYHAPEKSLPIEEIRAKLLKLNPQIDENSEYTNPHLYQDLKEWYDELGEIIK